MPANPTGPNGSIYSPRDYAAEARARITECETIAKHARQLGLDVTSARVNRNYHLFRMWYLGQYNTGYLIRQTGIKRMPAQSR